MVQGSWFMVHRFIGSRFIPLRGFRFASRLIVWAFWAGWAL